MNEKREEAKIRKQAIKKAKQEEKNFENAVDIMLDKLTFPAKESAKNEQEN